MRRWAIINKKSNEELVDLGWFVGSFTQRDAEGYALLKNFGVKENERVAVVETDF